MKFVRGLIAFFGLLAIAVGLGVFVPRPIAFGAASADGPRERVILLLENPIHTDIALRIDAETRAAFAFLAEDGLDPALVGAEWIVRRGKRAAIRAFETFALYRLENVPYVQLCDRLSIS